MFHLHSYSEASPAYVIAAQLWSLRLRLTSFRLPEQAPIGSIYQKRRSLKNSDAIFSCSRCVTSSMQSVIIKKSAQIPNYQNSLRSVRSLKDQQTSIAPGCSRRTERELCWMRFSIMRSHPTDIEQLTIISRRQGPVVRKDSTEI